MANYLISVSFALATAFVGMILPMASALGPIQRPMNILLGFVYGLGWFVAGFIADVRSRNVEAFGSMIWPLMVMLMVTYFLRKLLSRFPEQRFAIFVGCSFLLLLIVPRHWVATTPLKYIPTYSETLLSVY